MKIIDTKTIVTMIITFTLLIVFSMPNNTSFALSIPTITSLEPQKGENGALRVEFTSDNIGYDYAYELVNVNTNKKNTVAGSAKYYVYQNLQEATTYKIKLRTCSILTDQYICSNWVTKSASTNNISNNSSNNNTSNNENKTNNNQNGNLSSKLTTKFESYTFNNKNKTKNLGVTKLNGAKYSYNSSNSKIVKVNSKGIITSKKAGTATITIKQKLNGKTLSKKVKVKVPSIRSREKALKPWFDAIKKQRDWSYNSKYGWTKPTINSSKTKGTCITFPAVSLQRVGLLKSGEHVSNQNGSGFNKSMTNKVKSIIKSRNGYFTYSEPHKKIKSLGNKIKKGDIINYNTHTQIYAGKNKSGRNLYHTAGTHNPGNRAKLNVTSGWADNKVIGMIIRINTWNIYTTCTNCSSITGSNSYMAGQNATINYKPLSGYKIKSITVDGKKVSTKKYASKYTFKDIKKTHKIEVICNQK